jgi:tetratricopeptide (TPR) repeat protein
MQARVIEPAEMSVNFADAYTQAGQIYLASGDVREAERLWWRAAALNPRHAACLLDLASLFEKAGRAREALDVRQRLVAIHPRDPDHHWHLGVLLARLKQWDAAEAAFKKVVELAPADPRGHAGLAELCLQTGGRLTEAKTLALEAVRLEPVAPHYVLLSRVCAKLGDKPGAVSAIGKAVELNPDNLLYQRIQAQLQAGK